ncbi:GNAT family N-acetyltransferase [Vallicoccus soli]|uniref:GNAT family N-acetyltransferase n=1 Tax=Vallicoccus soli TaxID=2339232 RepID=A0A3A3YWX8_9ACTN|nr:GNAT family N-acetyltransferase [Vallicoccus soli]RJK96108.1 GNAT family N-acetyltransferase [Vallicoccus soli]
MSLRVRAAGRGDLPAVLALYAQLYPELAPPAADAGAWERTLGSPGRVVLLAVDGDEVLGTADLMVVPSVARGPYALVEHVVVDAGARRRGAGRALLAAAQERAAAAGCYKLQLSADDPQAFRFYEAAGWRHAARTYKRYLDGRRPPPG